MNEASQLIGQIIQDTYRIEKLIGEGGMGAVYEAAHLRLARRFAVKLLYPAVAKHPEALARFQREAQVTSALGHPHILEVIDFNHTPDGAPYIIMELLAGEDLAARLRRQLRLEPPAVASILRQAASALQAAHEQGIVHRDLKPNNIFLCRRGKRDDFVKVVDFGVSKVLGAQGGLTSTQALIGTPFYMSPEQAEQRSGEVDLRADIYALGVIIFEALTGRPPFAADSIPQLLFKVAYHEAPLLRSLRPDLPAALDAVVARALAKQREERWASAGELAAAFKAALGPAPHQALPVEDDEDDEDDEGEGHDDEPATAPPSQRTAAARAPGRAPQPASRQAPELALEATVTGPPAPAVRGASPARVPATSLATEETVVDACALPDPLEEAKKTTLSTSTLSTSLGEVTGETRRARRGSRLPMIAAGVLVVALGVGFVAFRALRSGPPAGSRGTAQEPTAEATSGGARPGTAGAGSVAVTAPPDARVAPRPDLEAGRAVPDAGARDAKVASPAGAQKASKLKRPRPKRGKKKKLGDDIVDD